ncbi:MAG: hypothetical protein WCT54_01230 [Patescibacteria group bacterium]
MNEKIPPFQPPVEKSEPEKQELTAEQTAQDAIALEGCPQITAEQKAEAAKQLEDYPEAIVAPEDRQESGPEIAEFETLVTAFEAEHSIEALMAIVDLTPTEAAVHPIRQHARLALIPIVAKLNEIEKSSNISAAEFEKLKAQYKRLLRAVGMINKNKVDHNR